MTDTVCIDNSCGQLQQVATNDSGRRYASGVFEWTGSLLNHLKSSFVISDNAGESGSCDTSSLDISVSLLRSLPASDVTVVMPFTVTIEQVDDDYMSVVQDAWIAASGDTPEISMQNLAHTIHYLFNRLENEPDDVLGSRARKQRSILRRHLVRG